MRNSASQNPKRFPTTRIATCAVLIILWPVSEGLAQTKRESPTKSSLCTRTNALDMIKQQIALTKTFNDSIRRINVLIRAADILWPYDKAKERVEFFVGFVLDFSYD